MLPSFILCCSVVDPDSRAPLVDPYPDPIPRGQKWPRKIETADKFHVLKCWMFSFEAQGFSCSLTRKNNFSCIFYNSWSSKPWIRIRIRGIHFKMLDPDSMNPDPHHCFADSFTTSVLTNVVDQH
jgi:hypothetical protein